MEGHGVKSLVMSDGLMGCPRQQGTVDESDTLSGEAVNGAV
jgi:hypothetical protein